MHKVRDGNRTLEFDGKLLSESSSRKPDSLRWVEFKLYRTTSGNYIISRIGHSTLYHNGVCDVTKRNSIKPELRSDAIENSYIPCEICRPDLDNDPEVFPERPRYWALVTDTPNGAIDALYKYDDQDARYLTNVARTLIERAQHVDKEIYKAYNVERIL